MQTHFGFVLLVLCSNFQLFTAKQVNGETSNATTQFSVHLLKSMVDSKIENVVISPVSLYMLLAIVQQGARAKTRQELDKVLNAPLEITKEGYHNLTSSIEDSDSVPSLRFICKARIKGEHNLIPEFKQALIKTFKYKFYSEKQGRRNNAANKAQNVPTSANGYKGILSKIVLAKRASRKNFIALANQLYFNGQWAHMDLSEKPIPFTPAPGEVIQTEAVHMKKFCYTGVSSELGAKWIHLPLAMKRKSEMTGIKPKNYWSKRKPSMLIILPVEKHRLENLMQRLTSQDIINYIHYTTKDKKLIELSLPKFEINTTSGFIPYLQKIGLHDVFQRTSDLSGISTDQLYMSKALQMAQIIVDNYGVRTSPQTDINFPYAFLDAWGEPEPFVVDEPFLFFIVDNLNHLPILAGKVTRPMSPKPLANDNDEFQVPV